MASQAKIDVRDQVRLSFEKSFRFCIKGVSYRLFRSSLTLAVVVVAVAFFTVLLSEGLMVRSASIGVHEEMESVQEADKLLLHMFHHDSSLDLSMKLAGMMDNPAALSVFARVTGLPENTVAKLASQCRVEQIFLNFFKSLSPGKRVILTSKNTGREIFSFLADQDQWSAFLESLEKMRSVRLPANSDVLRAFLDERKAFMASLRAARNARENSLKAVESRLDVLTGGADYAAWLGTASDADVEQWRSIVTESGFDLSRDAMERVKMQLRVAAVESRIAKLLQSREMREAWKSRFKNNPGLDDKLMVLKDESVAGLLGDGFSADERAQVADRFTRVKHLRELIGKLPPVQKDIGARSHFLDGRQMFLIMISFLVCMVGIANAMLMSITERFREIATMKCLGATDGFILRQFLIEAAFQGVIGGTVGMVIGMTISIIKTSLILGTAVFRFFPGLSMVYCAALTVVVGIVLAMLASIYPARAAARMAPMDAMRVE